MYLKNHFCIVMKKPLYLKIFHLAKFPKFNRSEMAYVWNLKKRRGIQMNLYKTNELVTKQK